MTRTLAFAVTIAATGCTTLGPMPAATAVAPVPLAHPAAEVGVAAVPGYFLSSGVARQARGTAMPQLSAVLEPDRWLGVPGLIAGGRLVGTDDAGTFVEPLLGYRHRIDRVGLGVVGYATRASHDNRGASLSYTRAGGEVAVDVRVTPESRYAEVHLQSGVALTALWADGRYCIDADGEYGIDCPDMPASGTMRAASADGLYPSLHAAAAIEIGRHLSSVFRGARLSLQVAGGTMPAVVGGEQAAARSYGALGFGLAVGLGAAD